MVNPNLVFHGKPCKYGHTLRRINGGGCVECNRRIKRHPLYKRWDHIKRRCHNPSDKAYKYYGARGITICDHWRFSFVTFLADLIAEIGPQPSPDYELDRIDNNGNYAPRNIRWASRKTQMRNSRRAKLTIEDARLIRQLYIKGTRWQSGNIGELAARFNISQPMIWSIARGELWREE